MQVFVYKYIYTLAQNIASVSGCVLSLFLNLNETPLQ